MTAPAAITSARRGGDLGARAQRVRRALAPAAAAPPAASRTCATCTRPAHGAITTGVPWRFSRTASATSSTIRSRIAAWPPARVVAVAAHQRVAARRQRDRHPRAGGRGPAARRRPRPRGSRRPSARARPRPEVSISGSAEIAAASSSSARASADARLAGAWTTSASANSSHSPSGPLDALLQRPLLADPARRHGRAAHRDEPRIAPAAASRSPATCRLGTRRRPRRPAGRAMPGPAASGSRRRRRASSSRAGTTTLTDGRGAGARRRVERPGVAASVEGRQAGRGPRSRPSRRARRCRSAGPMARCYREVVGAPPPATTSQGVPDADSRIVVREALQGCRSPSELFDAFVAALVRARSAARR